MNYNTGLIKITSYIVTEIWMRIEGKLDDINRETFTNDLREENEIKRRGEGAVVWQLDNPAIYLYAKSRMNNLVRKNVYTCGGKRKQQITRITRVSRAQCVREIGLQLRGAHKKQIDHKRAIHI